jgi:bifunctional non-homologous end joining protein LigD
LPALDPAGQHAGMPSLKPCLPTSTSSPPSGPDWLHEIKHDGYRMIAHRDGERVISRRGVDRFPS